MPIYLYTVVHKETGLSKSFKGEEKAKKWIVATHNEHGIPPSEFYILMLTGE